MYSFNLQLCWEGTDAIPILWRGTDAIPIFVEVTDIKSEALGHTASVSWILDHMLLPHDWHKGKAQIPRKG